MNEIKILAKEIYNEEENLSIVLAHRKTQCCPYVTWECRGEENYFWGHYFQSLETAIIDYHERLAKNHRIHNTPWEV